MNSPCWNKWGSKEPTAKWWHYGASAAVATVLTHPLDLLKVHLQTADTWFGEETCKAVEHREICKPVPPHEGSSCSQCLQVEATDYCPPKRRPAVMPPEPNTPPSRSLSGAFMRVYNTNGLLALYTGLSAALLRQLVYSTVRFGAYEAAKQYHFKQQKREANHYELIMMAGAAGALAGFLGAPFELVNVRMQNDIKIPLTCRRFYRNGIQGLFNVINCEGFSALFRGAIAASLRSALIGIGQMAFYDIVKREMIKRGQKDNTMTHLGAGVIATMVATALTLPLDVVKTRAMAAPANERVGLLCGAESLYNAYGITGLYRGFVPAMLRVLPQTLLTFLLMEQLRTRYGYVEN